MVEAESEDIVRNADTEDVSFLVVGDPFGCASCTISVFKVAHTSFSRATTHADLLLRCDTASPPIPYRIIHNASIMNAVGACGLALYNFGQTVSIPFFTDTWRPDSWLTRVRENWGLGLHTLCLVDIKVKEQSEENLARCARPVHTKNDLTPLNRGRKIYEPARYMSIPTAISQLLSLLPSAPSTDSAHPLSPDTTLAISVSRLGSPSQRLVSGTLAELSSLDEPAFGPPLHSLVLVGRQLHPMERDFAAKWAVDQQKWQQVARTVYGCTG